MLKLCQEWRVPVVGVRERCRLARSLQPKREMTLQETIQTMKNAPTEIMAMEVVMGEGIWR